MPFHTQPRLNTPRLGRFGEDRSSIAGGPSPGFQRGDIGRSTNFGLGPGSSSFQFPSLIDNSGTLPSQGGIPGSQSGEIPFFSSPNFGEEFSQAAGLHTPQSPEHTEALGRTQGFRTDREVVGTSLQGNPIFSFDQGIKDKITAADLDFESPGFLGALGEVQSGLDPGAQSQAGERIFTDILQEFSGLERGNPNVGPAGSFVQGAAGSGSPLGGAGLPQESVLNESLVSLIGSLIQSLITSGQFATGGGVSPPAPQALFRTDLNRLGANRF